jgi:hypothetical protein
MLTPLRTVGVTRYHRPQKNFTTIRNAFLRDRRVSPRAAKVGGYILSHANGFTQTQLQLAANTDLSVMTVRSALRDLAALGYVVMRVIRDHGRIMGTAYAVSDTPFTEVELAQLTSDDVPSEPCTESVCTELVPPKKTRSRRDSSPGEEDQPSGGTAGAAPVEKLVTPEEEPMPTATDPAQAQLFDVESPEPPPAEARRPEGAQLVVSAYVEAWRDLNDGRDPLKSAKGRIARDAKAMLTKGEATEPELVASARAMAATPFSNLGVQLNIHRRGGRHATTQGHSIPLPADYEGWAQGAAEDAVRREAEGTSPEVQALLDRYVHGDVA